MTAALHYGPVGFAAVRVVCLILSMVFLCADKAIAQSSSFAGNPQHTSQYPVRAQHLNKVLWSSSIDPLNTPTTSHYGAPLVTDSNTVIVPTVWLTGYRISAFDGNTGRLKYALTNIDYSVLSNPSSWRPVYQPTLVKHPSGLRLYYPGGGATVYYIENPDSDFPSPPVQLCFYTNLMSYLSNAVFKSRVFINTPLTASTNGEIYFGFRANGLIPAPINTNLSGFARLDAAGNGTYVFACDVGGSTNVIVSPMNCAPALSNDGETLYVVSHYYYLFGLDSQTLATKYKRSLGGFGQLNDSATASPVVGPDGDIYFGVNNYLFHFSADLATIKTPGVFGWDNTPAIVPASAVPSYTGPSSYLLFSKYNDYNTRNRIAILDPHTPQATPGAGTRMREVFTAYGCTPYGTTVYPTEWCINAAAVNAVNNCVFAPSEDGRLYRWDLAANSFPETIILNGGFREPYVPTVVGPQGVVYTINGGKLFAIGQPTNLTVTISSSSPDLNSVVALQPLTFTALVTNLNPADPAPTGTVTFQDQTFIPITRITNTLAANVPLSNCLASVTVSTLSSNSGNHFITAIYSGDTNYPSTRITMMQKVHALASVTTVTLTAPSPGSNAVLLTAVVTSSPSSNTVRTGMVSFWDDVTFLGQAGLTSTGRCSVVVTNLSLGAHAITARYYSDATHAASNGSLQVTPPVIDRMVMLTNGSCQLSFANAPAASFTVLTATELSVAPGAWTMLGQATEILPGQYQFNVPPAWSYDTARFYCVRSP